MKQSEAKSLMERLGATGKSMLIMFGKPEQPDVAFGIMIATMIMTAMKHPEWGQAISQTIIEYSASPEQARGGMDEILRNVSIVVSQRDLGGSG